MYLYYYVYIICIMYNYKFCEALTCNLSSDDYPLDNVLVSILVKHTICLTTIIISVCCFSGFFVTSESDYSGTNDADINFPQVRRMRISYLFCGCDVLAALCVSSDCRSWSVHVYFVHYLVNVGYIFVFLFRLLISRYKSWLKALWGTRGMHMQQIMRV